MHDSTLFDPYYSTLEWANMALTEIHHLSKERPPHEIELINSHTFMFYRVSLQYMYVSEYCKLLNEYYLKRPTNNAASFFKLMIDVSASKGVSFSALATELKTELSDLAESDYAKKLRLNRDKRFAHLDSNSPIGSLSVPGLTVEEIAMGFDHLRILYRILNKCASLFDIEFECEIPHRDGRTDNFIQNQSKYQEHYMDNYLQIQRNRYRNEGQ